MSLRGFKDWLQEVITLGGVIPPTRPMDMEDFIRKGAFPTGQAPAPQPSIRMNAVTGTSTATKLRRGAQPIKSTTTVKLMSKPA